MVKQSETSQKYAEQAHNSIVLTKKINKDITSFSRDQSSSIITSRRNHKRHQPIQDLQVREKDRLIKDVVIILKQWKDLRNLKFAAEQAAKKLKFSKKTLDDYQTQFKVGFKWGFDFENSIQRDERMSSLREFVRNNSQKRSIPKEQKSQEMNNMYKRLDELCQQYILNVQEISNEPTDNIIQISSQNEIDNTQLPEDSEETEMNSQNTLSQTLNVYKQQNFQIAKNCLPALDSQIQSEQKDFDDDEEDIFFDENEEIKYQDNQINSNYSSPQLAGQQIFDKIVSTHAYSPSFSCSTKESEQNVMYSQSPSSNLFLESGHEGMKLNLIFQKTQNISYFNISQSSLAQFDLSYNNTDDQFVSKRNMSGCDGVFNQFQSNTLQSSPKIQIDDFNNYRNA